MANITFANVLANTVRNSILAAGFCGITSIASPKAAALGTFAASLCSHAFMQGIKKLEKGDFLDEKDPLVGSALLVCSLVAGCVIGTTVGRYHDKDFNYLRVSSYQVIAGGIALLFAKMLGADGERLFGVCNCN